MEIINVETIEGIKKETVYNVSDFPYKDLMFAPICTAKRKTYYNIVGTFDIESTTIEPPYVMDKGKKQYEFTPYSFMYHWQFCILGKVVFGRTWEEFQKLLSNIKKTMKLTSKCNLVIYIHNLAYEFQFMKEFIKIDTMFAKDKRKPMKVNTQDGFEFRCSYFLSNMSLSKFCENTANVIHYKLVDEFDYRKIRTPKTELTEIEKAYCYNDVKGLEECLNTLLESDTVATIPLTNTGYVRREFRQAMKSNKKNYTNFVKTQLDKNQYSMLQRAFRGGNTHANRYRVNEIINDVKSKDISSSYPSSMMMDNYPIGKFTNFKCDSKEDLEYYCSKYCCVFDVEFYNIKAPKENVIPYLDVAHCVKQKGIVNDNGRVLKADYVLFTCTNIDLDIIRRTYEYDGFIVINAMYSIKGKLPKEFREMIMNYYNLKTLLKGIENKEYEYMKSKNRLNSAFGMCVTSIAHDDVEYNSFSKEWTVLKTEIEGALEKFYGSRNNFLSYQWGVFVTANARLRLQRAIDLLGNDLIYCDTDSTKYTGDYDNEFDKLNRELIEQAENNDIKAYVDRTDTKEGKEVITRFHLGIWDDDGEYLRFKTLGAKKYCYEQLNKKGEKEFKITVSGMSKKKGSKKVGCIENFLIGKQFKDIGRTTSWYNDSNPHKITIEGATFTTASNIGILDTTYELGVTDSYYELISKNEDNVKITVDND